MHARSLMTALTCLALAGVAQADPRDFVTAANVNSDAANGGGNSNISVSGFYTAKFVRVQGSLTKVTPNATFAREAVINLLPPGGQMGTTVVTNNTQAFIGTMPVDAFVRLQTPIAANGSWLVTALETYDDGVGADSRWDTLTVTLYDGPPASAVNLGLLAPGRITYHRGLTQYHWYKFELASDVSSGAGTYLDIDTEGSAGGVLDTEISLYNDAGQMVGYDDDSGAGLNSQLTYGVGTRPAVGNGTAYNGNDGGLPAGTYYLVVRDHGGGQGSPEVGWSFPEAPIMANLDTRVNIRTNTGAVTACGADFNHDGALAVQDIFDYLNAWFAGCP